MPQMHPSKVKETMTRKQKILKITGELLTTLLYNTFSTFPKDAKIRAITYHPYTNTADILIESEKYPELPEATTPDTINL